MSREQIGFAVLVLAAVMATVIIGLWIYGFAKQKDSFALDSLWWFLAGLVPFCMAIYGLYLRGIGL